MWKHVDFKANSPNDAGFNLFMKHTHKQTLTHMHTQNEMYDNK